jgi:hypothetical protein
MIHKYKKIYQTQDETISEDCVEWEGFTYLPPSGICIDNQATLNFNYIDCTGSPQTVGFLVSCLDGAYEIFSPLCVRNGSVVATGAGASAVTGVQYGVAC